MEVEQAVNLLDKTKFLLKHRRIFRGASFYLGMVGNGPLPDIPDSFRTRTHGNLGPQLFDTFHIQNPEAHITDTDYVNFLRVLASPEMSRHMIRYVLTAVSTRLPLITPDTRGDLRTGAWAHLAQKKFFSGSAPRHFRRRNIIGLMTGKGSSFIDQQSWEKSGERAMYDVAWNYTTAADFMDQARQTIDQQVESTFSQKSERYKRNLKRTLRREARSVARELYGTQYKVWESFDSARIRVILQLRKQGVDLKQIAQAPVYTAPA
ncbi:MAG: hypothetical protein PHS44_00635, partial [Candidatus Dojkabacteria bacterium]|nr:hypothetical protein [Candidatus Dojkabacteria bacterium]